ncbi:unnamed protein product [Clonostachys byssicola]|uniref:Uncharacterized protein n=1 Tax=Clonostachys byssicola TaxID=160290 RepID=A0A9N9XX86_9HYPO|nr:unnamed protein product [Clonostachys byssicola]
MTDPEPSAGHESSGRQELSASSPIQRLPRELVVDVLEHLRPSGSLTTIESNCHYPDVEESFFTSRTSFASLCLTSKLMHSLAIEYLYRTVVLANNLELLHFFRTISNNTNLRSMLTSFAWPVILGIDEVEFDGMDLLVTEVYPDLDPKSWAAIAWHNQEDAEKYKRVGLSSSMNAAYWQVLGGIFSTTPNLKSIFFFHPNHRIGMMPCYPGYDMFMGLLTPPWVPKTALRQLRTITLETWPGIPSHFVTRSLVALLLNSPIHRVEVKFRHSLHEFREALEEWDVPDFSAESVRELFTIDAWSQPDELVHVGRLYPNLTSLELDYASDWIPLNKDAIAGLSKGLLSLSGTLERLSLTCHKLERPNPEGAEPILPYLKDMKVLKHLTTTFFYLFGTKDIVKELERLDTLPSTLISLRLLDLNRHDSWEAEPVYDQALTRLEENCTLRLHNLKSVVLVLGTNHFDGNAATLAAKFTKLFALHGVKFRVITTEISRGETCTSWANIDSVNE